MKKIIIIVSFISLLYMISLSFVESKVTNFHLAVGFFHAIVSFLGFIGGMNYIGSVSGKLKSAIFAASFALLAEGIGVSLWAYYALFQKIDIPYPSMADWFFAISRILLVVVLIILILVYRTNVTKFRLYLAAVLGIIAGALVYYFTGSPEITDKASLTLVFLDVFWGIIGVITSGFAIIVLNISGGRVRNGIRILTLGLVTITIADIWFLFRANNGTLWNGDVSDITLLIAITAISYGVITLHESNNRLNA